MENWNNLKIKKKKYKKSCFEIKLYDFLFYKKT